MKCAPFLTPIIALLAACGTDRAVAPDVTGTQIPNLSTTTVTSSVVVPVVDFNVFIPCANGGAGEVVVLNGTIHFLFHVTEGDNVFVVHDQGNPQGLTGTGTVTGTTYHGTGVTFDQFVASAGFRETRVNNFRIIGTGGAPSLLLHAVFHITRDANGRVVVGFSRGTAECR
jgi:hypothetical protein